MSYTPSINSVTIEQWMQTYASPEALEKDLILKGFDAETVAAYIKNFKKQRIAKRQFKGFVLMGIGAFLGFISCLLTLTKAVPVLYDAILYGLTIIAVIIILIGLYFVFE